MNSPERIPHAVKQGQRRASPTKLAEILLKFGISRPAGGRRVRYQMPKKLINEISGLEVIVNLETGSAFLDSEKNHKMPISEDAIQLVSEFGKSMRKLPNKSELRRFSPGQAEKHAKFYIIFNEDGIVITEAVKRKKFKEKKRKPWQNTPEVNRRRLKGYLKPL